VAEQKTRNKSNLKMHPYLLTAVFIQIVAGIFSNLLPFSCKCTEHVPKKYNKKHFQFSIKNQNKKWLQLPTHPESPLPQSLKYKALLPHPMIRSEANCFFE
jgi:hypothetical protein